MGFLFEADDQLSAHQVVDAKAAVHDVLDGRPGDWAVRCFLVGEPTTFGVSVRHGAERGAVVFSARDAELKGMRSAVRSALKLALVMQETGLWTKRNC